MRIGIIGAGHTGVEAARHAAEAGSHVTIFSAESVLPYYRPRVPALAFGQDSLDNISMHPVEWYKEKGIDLRLNSPVEGIRNTTVMIERDAMPETFDRLVIATGAEPIIPNFAAGTPKGVFPLWNVHHAQQINKLIKGGLTLVIIGGGIIGVEAALRAVDCGLEVFLIEKMDRLMSLQLGQHAAETLHKNLTERGVHVCTESTVISISERENRREVVLSNKKILHADIVIVSIGARLNLNLPQVSKIAIRRGILVNSSLRTSSKMTFAGGDIIEFNGVMTCTSMEAGRQGKIAGENAIADVKGETLHRYVLPIPTLHFKYKNLELHAAGINEGADCEEIPLESDDPLTYRALIKKEDRILGIQMVGSRKDFSKFEKTIVREGE